MLPFPLQPELPSGPISELLSRLLEALSAGRAAELPPVAGLRSTVLVRWIYRAWMDARGSWAPLVQIAPERLSEQALVEPVEQAGAGWLHLLSGGPPALRGRLISRATARVSGLILDVEGPEVLPPRRWVEEVCQLDAVHLIAVDPALSSQRQRLLAMGKVGAAMLVTGAPGSGRRSLASWAHHRLSSDPLVVVSARQGGRLLPDRWALFEEPTELGPDALAALRMRVLREPEPAPLGPASGSAVRPVNPAFDAILGVSAPLCAALRQVELAASTDLPVLILGEPGTGKESLARAVHAASGRSGPLITMDVGALPRELAESELFGHGRGAFTGAVRARLGAFRAAHGGTLFLDEIGNLAYDLQILLLRALQERQVRPIGEESPVPVDVRVVAATNADLYAMASREAFRPDLLQRIAGVVIRLPPLRERPEDVLILARAIAEEEAQRRSETRSGRARRSALPEDWLTPEAERALMAWSWPGNVRELGNVIRWAAAQVEPPSRVGLEHLGEVGITGRAPTVVVSAEEPTAGALAGMERRLVSALAAVTVRVPSLVQRGPLSMRAAILGLLDGVPIRSSALEMLAHAPWSGGLPELCVALQALRTGARGTIGVEDLAGVLTATAAPGGARALLSPTLDAQGRITGLIRELEPGLLLVGRRPEAREFVARSDRDLSVAFRARLEELHVELPRAQRLALRHVAGLSRSHLLVRVGLGRLALLAPSGVAPVCAGALDDAPETMARVGAGSWLDVGDACEIRFLSPEGLTPLLQLFVFASQEAWDRAAVLSLGRLVGAASEAATLEAPPPEAPPLPLEDGRRVWKLDVEERTLLLDALRSFEGRNLQTHLQRALAGTSPAMQRLNGYLTGTRAAQYCGRLYAHNPDAAAEALRVLGPEGLARLPSQVRASLETAARS